MSLLEDFGKSLATAGNKFLETYDKIARPIGRSISTGVLLTDQDNPELQDGFQLSDIGATYQRAKTISPGQALLGASDIAPTELIRKTAGALPGTKTPTFLKSDFNIYDEQQRIQAFEKEMAGKLASGSVDAVVTWFADPLVLGGKAIKAARIGTKISKGIEQRVPTTAQEIQKSVVKGGWDEFLNFATRQDVDAAALLKNKTIQRSSNPELLASIFGDVTDKETGRVVLRAVLGDASAVDELGKIQKHADIPAIIARKQGKIDKLRPKRDVNGEIIGTTEHALLTKELEALKVKDKFFKNALEAANQNVYAGVTGTATRFRATEALRAKVGSAKADVTLRRESPLSWKFDDYQYSPVHGISRIVTWGARQRPSGWLSVKGINSSGSSDELIAFMDNVKPWVGAEGEKIKRGLLNRYVRATNDAERAKIGAEVEKLALRAIGDVEGFNTPLSSGLKAAMARKLNVSQDDLKTMTDVIYYETVKRRNTTLAMARSKEGWFLDEEGRKVIVPLVSSQLADALPMVDIRLFQKMAKEHGSGIRKWTAAGTDRINAIYETFDSFWRPSVLLRLGYPMRNVGEGTLRAMAYMNGFLNYAQPIKGTSNFVRNRKESIANKIRMRATAQRLVVADNKKVPRGFKTWSDILDSQKDEIAILNRSKADNLKEIKKLTARKNSVKSQSAKNRIQVEINKLKEHTKLVDESLTQAKSVVDDINKLSTIKGIKGNRYRIGQTALVHKGLKIQGAFEGDIGQYAMGAVSAERKTALELMNPMAIGSDAVRANLISGGWGRITAPIFDSAGKIAEDSPEYWSAISELGRVYRNDEVTKRLLQYVDPEDGVSAIVKEARTNKKLQIDLQNSGIELNSTDIRAHANVLAQAMKAYFPDAALRMKLAKGDVGTETIKKALWGRNDLKPVMGETLAMAGEKTLRKQTRSLINKAFKYIGALPEDTLVRHPFYNSVYKKVVTDQVDRALAAGKEIRPDQLQMFVANAHRVAMRETNRTLYTIQRYSNFSAAFAFFSPFIQAQLNTVRVWGRMTFENPQIIGRSQQIWNATEKAGLEEVDPGTGETYVTFQGSSIMPDWLEEKIGSNTVLRFPKRGANLVLAGEPWWNPGAGPVVQVTASEILKKAPNIDQELTEKYGVPIPAKEILDFIVQERVSEKRLSWDLVLPASAKRVQSLMGRSADKDFANTVTSIYAVEMQRYKDGTRATEPTYEEAESKATWFMALRLVSNLSLPVIPQFRSEYQPWIDIWRRYQEEGDVGGLRPEERFYKDYPEYFTLAYSNSKSFGADPTVNAVARAKEYEGLVADVARQDPYLIQLITNTNVERDFDQAAYVWQLTNTPIPGDPNTFRSRLDPVTAVKQQDIKAGWIDYMKFMDALDAELERNGIKSLNSTLGKPYAEVKENFINQLKMTNQTWANEYGVYEIGGLNKTLRGINEILEDEKFMDENDSGSWALMREYMTGREIMIKELQNRESIGGSSNITAQSNADLQLLWDEYVSGLKADDTLFSSWYNRFLDRDTLEPVE